MKILITGGSGYLGRNLTNYLLKKQSNVSHETLDSKISISWVSRSADTPCPDNVNLLTYQKLANTQEVFDIIINLSGAGIADSRWSDNRKLLLLNSRLQPTQAVIDYIERVEHKPSLFISGSAVGWYGAQNIQDASITLNEESECVNNDFAHQLCAQWEKLAMKAVDSQVGVAIVRTGIVLSHDGGMISKLKLPFLLGLGGQLGNGKQIMSWISLNDWIRAIEFIIDDNSKNAKQAVKATVYNLTAPDPTTNQEFTQSVGQWLQRPTILKQPNFILKMLFGEMSTLLIDGQRIVPEKLLAKGFQFEDKTILQALQVE